MLLHAMLSELFDTTDFSENQKRMTGITQNEQKAFVQIESTNLSEFCKVGDVVWKRDMVLAGKVAILKTEYATCEVKLIEKRSSQELIN